MSQGYLPCQAMDFYPKPCRRGTLQKTWQWVAARGTALTLAKAATKLKRGQVWEVAFEPQNHKGEPGERGRWALVIQTNILNSAGHATPILIPGTTRVYRDAQGDGYPLRVSVGNLGSKNGRPIC